jgi:hypothetical protein
MLRWLCVQNSNHLYHILNLVDTIGPFLLARARQVRPGCAPSSRQLTQVFQSQLEIQSTQRNFALLEDFWFDVTAEDQATFWTAFGQPSLVAREQAAALQRQEDERLRFMQELQASTVEFQAELASIEVEVKKLFTYSDIDSSEEYAGAVRVIEMRLKEAKENAVLINSREKLFEFPITDFDDIGRLSKVLLQIHFTTQLTPSSLSFYMTLRKIFTFTYLDCLPRLR